MRVAGHRDTGEHALEVHFSLPPFEGGHGMLVGGIIPDSGRQAAFKLWGGERFGIGGSGRYISSSYLSVDLKVFSRKAQRLQ